MKTERYLLFFLFILFSLTVVSCGPSDEESDDQSIKPDTDQGVNNPCFPNPCRETHKTVCTSDNGKASCSCDAGYINGNNGNCMEPNPCEPNPCSEENKTVCTNEDGSAACGCDEGYHDEDGICVEDSVCSPNPCGDENKTVCTDNNGNAECSCDEGHHDVEGTCIADTVCEPNPCNDANKSVCSDEDGAPLCSCDEGYHDENGTCIEDSVCSPNPCSDENKTVCSDEDGTAVCSCDEGYHDADGTCIVDKVCDPNPCSEANRTICADDNGTAVCSCDGEYHDEAGTCVANTTCNPNPCDEANKTVCADNNGTAECSCDDGYHDDGGTCVEDDACDPNPCSDENKTTCVDENGTAVCSCDNGYSDDGNGECLLTACQPNPCNEPNRSICGDENLDGTAECACDSGYHDEAGTCVENNACEPNPCTDTNKTVCADVNGAAICSCDSGFHDENGSCVIDYSVGWCKTHWPASTSVFTGNYTEQIYGHVFVSGITDKTVDGADPSPYISAEAGYGPTGSNPSVNPEEWTWFDTVINMNSGTGNNDEYMGGILAPMTPGTYDYAFRFSADEKESWTYCDTTDHNYEPSLAGKMTVTIPPVCDPNPCTDPNKTQCTDVGGAAYCSCDEGYRDFNGACISNTLSTTLLISEYVEGSVNNKAIELYNNTDSDVDLVDYQIWKIQNGGQWQESSPLILTGILPAGEVYVIVKDIAEDGLKAKADLLTSFLVHSGDDAIGLAKNDGTGTYIVIDAVGTDGPDPGIAWDVAGTALATQEHTLLRKKSIVDTNTDWDASAGTNSENSEWIVEERDYIENLGEPTLTYVPNPCRENPCGEANKTVCTNDNGTAICSCDDGYHDENGTCIDSDVCDPNPCNESNKTVCADDNGIATCSCDWGYHDEAGTCVANTTCNPNPCDEANKTVCADDNGNPVCSCDDGYHDEAGTCVMDTTCNPNPCDEANKTVCADDNGNPVCSCDDGYHDEAGTCIADTTCNPNPCDEANKTVCADDNGNPVCSCDDGYHDEAGTCVMDTTCNPNPCDEANKTVCADDNGNPVCSCDDGYHDEAETCVADPVATLIISEYVEGSGNNKAIELFNNTGGEVDLSDYQIWKIQNGGTWDENTPLDLSGSLADGAVYTIVNSAADAEFLAVAELSNDFLLHSGDDAVGLALDNGSGTFELIDSVGTDGADPGAAWDVAGVVEGTKEHTLIRKEAVSEGNTDWTASSGTDVDDSEWIVEYQDYSKNFGAPSTEYVYDPCDPNPCTDSNKTVCTNDNGSAVCSCDTGYHDESDSCVVNYTVDWCKTHWPESMNETRGLETERVYGHVLVSGITDVTFGDPDPSPYVSAEVGYGPEGSNPSTNPELWTWFDAEINMEGGTGDNDEYMARMTAPLVSDIYDYAFRFSADEELSWSYCDGVNHEYDPSSAREMTVTD